MRRYATVGVLLLAFASCGGDDPETVDWEASQSARTGPEPQAATSPTEPRASEPTPARRQRLGEARSVSLRPVGDPSAADYGRALLRRRHGPDRIEIEAFLSRPSGRDEAFEIWLYNDSDDVKSLGAQVSDENGDFAGQAKLPADWHDYEYLDVSREPTDTDHGHSGESILRGRLR
jgi:hypothetical protein